MGWLLLALLLKPLVVDVVRAESSHLIIRKSISDLYGECRKYLGYNTPRPNWQPPDACENYCGQILIRLWSDPGVQLGRETRFFIANMPLQEFTARAAQCVAQVDATDPVDDVCRRGDDYFDCFLQPNTTTNFERTFYLPNTDLQQRQAVIDCSRILQMSTDELRQIHRQGLLESPQGPCLVRCFLIRQKLYSEAFGLDPFRVLVELDQFENYYASRDQAIVCAARLQRQFLQDRCTLAARIAAECVEGKLLASISDAISSICDS